MFMHNIRAYILCLKIPGTRVYTYAVSNSNIIFELYIVKYVNPFILYLVFTYIIPTGLLLFFSSIYYIRFVESLKYVNRRSIMYERINKSLYSTFTRSIIIMDACIVFRALVFYNRVIGTSVIFFSLLLKI